MHQIAFVAGFSPRPRWEACSAPSDPELDLGRERREERRREDNEGKGWRREGRIGVKGKRDEERSERRGRKGDERKGERGRWAPHLIFNLTTGCTRKPTLDLCYI